MTAFGPLSLRTALGALPVEPPLWVAFSGGADSLALLHAAARLWAVSAVHVDHGLHSGSDRWAEHCARVCDLLGVALHTERVSVGATGEGIEAAARQARYSVFERLVADGGTVLTAHHLDDQAETVLLRLCRGTGVDGLAGMPACRPLGGGLLARPLLGVSRDDLRAYARDTRIEWIEDPANDDPAFDRNHLRHRVLPVLEARWPDVAARIARAAGHARDAREAFADLSDAWIGDDETIDVTRLDACRPPVRAIILRRWLERRGVRPPGRARLERGLDDLLAAGQDRQPELRWSDARIRRHAGRLWLLPPSLPPVPRGVIAGRGTAPVVIDGLGRLHFETATGAGLSPAVLDGPWHVRFRVGGERLRVGGATRRVKDLLRESGLPPWERARLPLMYAGGRLVCLPGVAIADDCVLTGGRVPVWEPLWRPFRRR